MPRRDAVEHLTSPDRFVVPLPSISEPAHGCSDEAAAEQEATPSSSSRVHEQDAQTDDARGGPMLLDYLSRLARFEPRVRRISLSRRRNLPDATPFARSASGVASPRTPASPPSRDTGRDGQTELIQDPRPGPAQPRRGGYTLLDFERMLLSPFRRTTETAHDTNATGGLDIDLSDALDDMRFHAENDDDKADDDRFAMPKDKGRALLLDLWTHEQVVEMLRSAGIITELSKKGFHDVSLIFDTSDSRQHRLSCVDASLFSPSLNLGSQDRFLIDVYLKRRETFNPTEMVCYQLMQRLLKFGSWEGLHEATGEIRAPYVGLEGWREVTDLFDSEFATASRYTKLGNKEWNVTELAWMQMHDPLRPVTRPLLPGQRFPGLGVGRIVGSCMESMAARSSRTDALLNFPFHYHNAVMYATRGYRHLDPIYEAYVSWMSEQLRPFEQDHGFCFVAWAVVSGHLRRVVEAKADDGSWELLTSRMERWSSSEQVFPTGEAPKRFVESKAHRAMYAKYKAILDKDGGANMEGVHTASVAADPREKRARLIIDLEGCPELWQYSKIWHNRDPETGNFR